MPLAAILALAPQFISAGKSLFDFISHVRETAQQTGEWIPEHEQAFADVLAAAGQSPQWKPRE
jgi:hypothetical protein